MSGTADAGYVHGTTPAEQARLTRMNAMLNVRSLDALALAGGESVLEVGAGLAHMARGMAHRGAARVVGIEKSARQLDEARRQARDEGDQPLLDARRVDLREGDALDLPLADGEWGTFDVAHARFLLEHVTDPLAVVRQMVRAVRPGGRIVLEDDDHDMLRLWPEPGGFETLWRGLIRSYDRLGCDPYVGRRLVALLHEAGAAPARNALLWFGACSGEADDGFETLALNVRVILVEAGIAIRAAGGLDEATFDGAIAAFDGWSRRPDAAIWYAMNWAEGRRRAD
jgi:SAM-dependent methyltransferase